MKDNLIYLDTYVLQQGMRIRMPKSIEDNIGAERGKTKFKISFDKKNNYIVLEAISEEKEVA